MAIRLMRRYIASSNTVEESPVFKANYLLGELLEKQGNRPAAAEEYRAALALAHTFARAQDALKRVTH
jgi:TolA-binding protein